MIREVIPEDAADIAKIQVETWRSAYSGIVPAAYLAAMCCEKQTGIWRELIADSLNRIVVSTCGNRLEGWASGGACRDEDLRDAAEIYAIYVSPGQWGQGIGGMLMRALELRLPPATQTTLWVLRGNARAMCFYRSVGYQADGTEKDCTIGGERLTEIRLCKTAPRDMPKTP